VSKREHWDLTDMIIGCFYKVYNTLGYGFLEQVYERALLHELTKIGLDVKRQHPLTVFYDSIEVGDYFADLIVNDTVIVELKTADEVHRNHEAQLVSYLKATGKRTGLLLLFGKQAIVRRIYNNPYNPNNP